MTFTEFKKLDPIPVLTKLGAEPQRKNNVLKCRAIWRGDSKPSVEWTCKNGVWLWNDRTNGEGGSIIDFAAKVEGLDPNDKANLAKISEVIHDGFRFPFEKRGTAETKNSNIVRSHVYEDSTGRPILRKTKFKDGNWNTQSWGSDQWKNGAGDKTKIPFYRASSLSDVSSSEWLWLCEGEKDADSLAALGARAVASCCLLYTSPSPRDQRGSRMPSSA